MGGVPEPRRESHPDRVALRGLCPSVQGHGRLAATPCPLPSDLLLVPAAGDSDGKITGHHPHSPLQSASQTQSRKEGGGANRDTQHRRL